MRNTRENPMVSNEATRVNDVPERDASDHCGPAPEAESMNSPASRQAKPRSDRYAET